MGRTFVLGDIHGAWRAVQQVVERSGFNPKEDRLIFLGDVVDGWSEVRECIEWLCTILDLVFVRGNHDHWFMTWYKEFRADMQWVHQGGQVTMDAYKGMSEYVPYHHKQLFSKSVFWHEQDNMLFVHGGWEFTRTFHPIGTSNEDCMWNRSMWDAACALHEIWPHNRVHRKLEVFIGHTQTTKIDPEEKPVHRCRVWNLDQGAGWDGKLTMMEIPAKLVLDEDGLMADPEDYVYEFWQSDNVKELYPEEVGRE